MKRPVIFTSWKDSELAQITSVLQRCCFQVQFFPRGENLLAELRKGGADLVIVDGAVAKSLAVPAREKKSGGAPFAHCPLVVLREEEPDVEPCDFAHYTLPLPLDLAQLHGLLQKLLKCCPRKHLRMTVRLPGVIFREQGCSFGDILSLGTGGAFIKTGCRDFGQNESLEVVIPLMGMKKELELQSRVLYRIVPSPENNYQQGVGVTFTHPDSEAIETLQQYITRSLLEEIAPDERCDHPFVTLPAPPSGDGASRAREPHRRLFLHS